MRIRKSNRASFRLCEDRGPIRIEANPQSYVVRSPSNNIWENTRGPRGSVRRFSRSSRTRLVRLSANNIARFKYFVTLTYHEVMQDGRLSKQHLNRFLTNLRKYGADFYLWVLEFQERGAIHYHMWLGEHELERRWNASMGKLRNNLNQALGEENLQRQAMVIQHLWLTSSDQKEDEQAGLASVDYQVVRKAEAVKAYSIKYGAKAIQKELPPSVAGVGRWWGASRKVKNLKLLVVEGGDKRVETILSFLKTHGFPLVGTNVVECDQATDAWTAFIEELVGATDEGESR